MSDVAQLRADLFTAAGRAPIDQALPSGHRLFKAGRRRRGECPICHASHGKKADGAFWVDDSIGRWGCFSGGGDCAGGGDVIAMEQLVRGGTAREAAARLAPGEARALEAAEAALGVKASRAGARAPAAPRAPVVPAGDPEGDRWKAELAASLWRDARAAAGTPVEIYLRGRAIRGHPLAGALQRLRFHPNAYHSGPSHRPVTAPAMVGIEHAPGGATGGVHVTYLAAGGQGKARLEPAKKMWGPQSRAAPLTSDVFFENEEPGPVQWGGVWLTSVHASGPLVVAEGIESALSAAQLLGEPCRIVAALSLNRLSGGRQTDAYGRIDINAVRPDPASPAFTWPSPEVAPWPRVIIAVDRDMKPVSAKVRRFGGGTAQVELSADDRARICAGLAEAAWRRACPGLPASAVTSIAPGPGRDFNDELREQVAG
jgi:hypothetical protein